MIFPVLVTISCYVRFVHGKGSVSSEKTSGYFLIIFLTNPICSGSKFSNFDYFDISCNRCHDSLLFGNLASREHIV